MRKILLTFLMLIVAVPLWAQYFEFESIRYHITDAEAKTVAVTTATSTNPYSGEVVIPAAITYNGTTYSVTEIEKKAFYESEIVGISVPSTISSIGDYAFEYCASLKHVAIEDGTTTLTLGTDLFTFSPFETLYIGRDLYFSTSYTPFSYNANGNNHIVSVEIGSKVTAIPNNLLYNCTNIKSLIVGSGVLSVGTSQSQPIKTIFLGNTQPTNWTRIKGTKMNYASKQYASDVKVYSSLNSMFEVDGVKYVPVSLSARTCETIDCSYNSSSENVNIGETVSYHGITLTVEYINPYTCYDNEYIKTCNITHKKDIGEYAFYGCSNIVEIDTKAKIIEPSAFRATSAVTNASINADSISTEAFSYSMRKNPATLSLNARNIGINSFYATSAIQTANIVVTDSISKGAFYQSMSNSDISATMDIKTPIISDFAFKGTSKLNVANIECETLKRSAFNGSGIVDLNIQDCVKSIGNACFANNSSLTTVAIGSGLKDIPDSVFCNCQKLQGITIPQNISSIGNCVFLSCYNLANVIISDSETELALGCNPRGSAIKYRPMFYGCGLDYVYIGRNITYDTTSSGGYSPFFNNTSLRKIVNTAREKNITANEFEGCTNLQEITLEEGVQTLSEYSFNNCSSLPSITLPNSITSTIGEYCFSNCTLLSDIKIGTGIPSISDRALMNCSSLTRINIPNNVDSIKNYVFKGCTALNVVIFEEEDSELTLGYNNTTTSSSVDAIDNCPMFADCPLDSVFIGRNLTYSEKKSTGYSPFYHNTTLRTVLITDYETAILENEFYLCTGLKTVQIGNGVKTIGNWAFSGCQSLEYWSFGSGLTTIGQEAFSDCENVTKIYSNTATPPVCGSQALDDINKWYCTLYIPKGTSDAYRSAEQWMEFPFMEESNATPITSIKINSSISSLYVGEDMMLAVEITPEECSNEKLLWSSNNEDVLSVDENGVITAKKHGTATITATTTDGTNLTASKDFEVLVLNLGTTGLHFNVLSSKDKTLEVTSIAPNAVTGMEYYYTGNQAIPSTVNVRGEDYRVVSIGENAFEHSQGLTSVSIPNSVTKISQYAFYACSGLTSIILPDSVATIETAAFHSCSNLETIEFGKQLTTLGSNILNSCSNLTSVKVNSSTPATAAENTFNGIPSSVILYVPQVSDVDKYAKATGWSAFTSIQPSTKLVESIKFDITTKELAIGDYLQLNISFTPTDATDKTISWKSSNTSVATVNASGLVTAVGAGTATITATTTDGTNLMAECVVTVEGYVPGDANGDGSLSVSDIVMVANHIMGVASESFSVKAADMNEDGSITVSDIVALSNDIMNGTSASSSAASIEPFSNMEAELSVEDIILSAGETKRINLHLENAMSLTAFQMDVRLPEGVKIVNGQLSQRAMASHNLLWKEQANGTYRLMSYSLLSDTYRGHEGALLSLDVVADNEFVGGDMTIHNILVCESNGAEYRLSSVNNPLNHISLVDDINLNSAQITVEDNNIVIKTPNEGIAYIYSIDGITREVQVMTGSNKVSVETDGIFIVKFGNIIKKIMIN